MLKTKVFFIILFLLLSSTGLYADSLTIYSGGKAYLTENKSLFFNKGINSLHLTNVPNTIEKDSLIVSGLSEDQMLDAIFFGADFIKNKLLKDYVGKEISLMTPQGEKNAKLVNASNPFVVEIDGKIVVNPDYPIAFPAKDDYMEKTSPLTLKILSRKNIKGNFVLKYVFTGLRWNIVYRLNHDDKKNITDLESSIIISNSTSKDIFGTTPVLVDSFIGLRSSAPVLMSEAKAGGVRQDSEMLKVFLTQPVDILAYQDVIYPWKSLKGIKTTKKYEVEFYEHQKNIKKNGAIVLTLGELNIDMPKGKMMVFNKNTGELTGELMVGSILKGEKPEVKYGSVYDLIAEKKQVKYRYINERTFEATYRITIKNKSNQNRRVVIKENVNGQWLIDKSNVDYKKNGSSQFLFDLILDSNKTKIIEYSISVTK